MNTSSAEGARHLSRRLVVVPLVLAAAALRLVGLDRFPPGLHFDEAVYGLLALDIVHGARPVFFSAYTGREALYMYVLAVMFGGIGATAYAIRLTSAFVGIVTVAVTYALARDLYGRRVAFASTAFLAVSYWHITVSRNGYPNVLIPPLEALSVLFLWRAWRGNARRDWLLGGALAALVLHTYLAARLWPVALAVLAGYGFLSAPRAWRSRTTGLAIACGAALVVFAPLGLYFWRHPHDFFERANQVLAWRQLEGVELVRAYAANIVATARGFLVRGDPRWHFNLPGRPIFSPAEGALFILGLAVCVRRARDLAYALPVLWVAVMSLPGILTLEMQPAGQRMFGVFPALVLIPGIGLVRVLDAVSRLFDRRLGALAMRPASKRVGLAPSCARLLSSPRATIATATLLAGVAAVGTVRDYFGTWTRLPETRRVFNADCAAVAPLAAADVRAGRTVVLLTEHYKHATVVFLAPETADGAVWADPTIALPFPLGRHSAGPLVYYRLSSFLPDEAPAARWLRENARSAEVVWPSEGDKPAGGSMLAVWRYEVAPGDIPPAPRPDIKLGEIALGTGNAVRTVHTAPRGRDLELALDWAVESVPQAGRGFALHLRDAAGFTWAQADVAGYLSDQWRPGDRIRQWFTLELPAAMPPGTYSAHLALVDEKTGPLPGSWPGGTGTEYEVATVRVTAKGGAKAPADASPEAVFGGGLALLAHKVGARRRPPGGTLDIGLRWARIGPVNGLRRVRFSARSDSNAVALGELPIAGGYEPSTWADREMLHGRYRLELPADIADGEYRLVATVPGAKESFALGMLAVESGGRLYRAPVVEYGLEARFGGGVELVGLALSDRSAQPGDVVTVTLVWRADVDSPAAAKVFTHLTTADRHPVAQHDSVPALGARPVNGWLAGEFIVDAHPIQVPADLPPGQYAIWVGLYDDMTGRRQHVTSSRHTVADNALRLPVSLRIASH